MPGFSHLLTDFLDRFQHLGWPGVFAYGFSLVIAQMLLLPLSPAAVAAGSGFGFWKGWVAISIGCNVGATVNFLLARYFARDAIARRLRSHEKFRLIDEAIASEGWKIITLLRFCPMPFGLTNYAYGLTAIGFWPYLLATFATTIPANCFFVWLGVSARQSLAAANGHAKNPGEFVILGVGLLAAFAALTYITKIANAAVAKSRLATAPGEAPSGLS